MKQYLKRLVTSVFALVLFSAPCLARKDVQEDRSCDSDAPRILRNGKTEIIDSSLFRPSGVHGNHNVTVASLPVSGSIGLKYVNKFHSAQDTSAQVYCSPGCKSLSLERLLNKISHQLSHCQIHCLPLSLQTRFLSL